LKASQVIQPLYSDYILYLLAEIGRDWVLWY